jgi:hypothetical protein
MQLPTGWWSHRIGLFLHLILIGIPFRFGFLPTGWGYGWLHSFDSPCSLFRKEICTGLEVYAIRDFGMRFLLHYELAWVVWFIMRKSVANTVAFHKILLGTGTCSLMSMLAYYNTMKNINNALAYQITALCISVWAILMSTPPMLPSMKWSIPGNALFFGGVRANYVGCTIMMLNRRCTFQ